MGLLKSTDPADEGFLPDLLLIGPGIGILSSSPAQLPEGNTSLEGAVLLENSAIPKNIILPESLKDLGALAADGREGITTYEPFGPSSFIGLAEINLSAPQSGRYYAAVYENTRNGSNEGASLRAAEADAKGGHYGLVVGYREEFSFTDRMIAPIQIASVYIWEGQSIIMILHSLSGGFNRWRAHILERKSSQLVQPDWDFSRLSVSRHQLSGHNSNDLQPQPGSLWSGGLYHHGHNPVPCSLGSGIYPPGQG